MTSIVVNEYNSNVAVSDLKKLFGGCGNITCAVLMREGDGKSKCFGFVTIENAEVCRSAVYVDRNACLFIDYAIRAQPNVGYAENVESVLHVAASSGASVESVEIKSSSVEDVKPAAEPEIAFGNLFVELECNDDVAYGEAPKGEPFEATIHKVEGYADIMLIMHFDSGAVRRTASTAGFPILLVGDGQGHHPPQILLGGDIIHMHVAGKDVLHEMVRIVQKKPAFHVTGKILVLVDTWQEAFGGARARYPQYYAAYQELLCAGAVYPQRPDRAAPIFTPPQLQPLSSYPPNIRNVRPEAADSDLPTLSLAEIQNARGIMVVLAEMLHALDPGNREGLKQEVIIDLVEQCRSYKQRVVQLVTTTGDEELLDQGLALNDDLPRVLAKHDAIAFGTAIRVEKGKSHESLVEVGDADSNRKAAQRSTTSTSTTSSPNCM